MSKLCITMAVAAAVLLTSGCSLTGEPRMPEPAPATWQQGAATPAPIGAVAHSPDRTPGRNYWDEQGRRSGARPRNPDYGYMKPGREVRSSGWAVREWREPLPSGEWSAPLPSGGWSGPAVADAGAAAASSTAAPMARPSEPMTPAPAPGTSSFVGAAMPRAHSTPGGGTGIYQPAPRRPVAGRPVAGRPMQPVTHRPMQPAPRPMQPMQPPAQPMPAPRPQPMPPARPSAPNDTYSPPPPPRR